MPALMHALLSFSHSLLTLCQRCLPRILQCLPHKAPRIGQPPCKAHSRQELSNHCNKAIRFTFEVEVCAGSLHTRLQTPPSAHCSPLFTWKVHKVAYNLPFVMYMQFSTCRYCSRRHHQPMLEVGPLPSITQESARDYRREGLPWPRLSCKICCSSAARVSGQQFISFCTAAASLGGGMMPSTVCTASTTSSTGTGRPAGVLHGFKDTFSMVEAKGYTAPLHSPDIQAEARASSSPEMGCRILGGHMLSGCTLHVLLFGL